MIKHHALGIVRDIDLREQLMGLLPGYIFYWNLELNGAINTAADLRPSFMLIDLDDDSIAWRNIAVALRSNPATRRIPMLGITSALDEDSKKSAASVAINELIERESLSGRLPDLVNRRARVWDEDYYTLLNAVCDDELPEIARKGIELFDNHEFWEAHEQLEHAWIEVRPNPVGEVYRSILQVGVAYYQIQKGNYRGAIKMFLRAVQWLDPLPDECQGIDIAGFKRDAAASRAALESLGAARIREFDQSLFKPVPFVRKKITPDDETI